MNTLPVRAVLLVLACLGCQSVIGIEDRYYDAGPDGTAASGGSGGIAGTGGEAGAALGGSAGAAPDAGPPPSAQCTSYCDSVMQNCVVQNLEYSAPETCLGVCAALDVGEAAEPVGNNVACRANRADLAGITSEPNVYCPLAGPRGGGVCGAHCEAYCTLLERVCPEQKPAQTDCMTACAALEATTDFDPTNLFGDTLACRFAHLSAATLDPATHCDHTGFLPPDYCIDPDEEAVACSDYCRVIMVGCQGAAAVYESAAQCLAACGALMPGKNSDRAENSVGCRKYHSYAALIDPTLHCPHAGPSGDGYCGADTETATGNCTSYCLLAEGACKMRFDMNYTSQEDCRTQCGALAGAAKDALYSVASAATGDTVQCRILHATRAFADSTFCNAAFGAAPCGG